MKLKYGFALLIFLLNNLVVWAQPKNTSHASQIWLAYFNQTRLNDKWGLWGDFQLRTREDLVGNLSTLR